MSVTGPGSGERLAVPRPVPTDAELAEWQERVEQYVVDTLGPDEPDPWHEKMVEQFRRVVGFGCPRDQEKPCLSCGGAGEIAIACWPDPGARDEYDSATCPACGGSGRREP